MTNTLEYYQKLSYTIDTECRDDDGDVYWIASYPLLPGCKTDGPTETEAVANVQEMFDDYILTCFENDLPIPTPDDLPDEYIEIVEMPWSSQTTKVSHRGRPLRSKTEQTHGVFAQ